MDTNNNKVPSATGTRSDRWKKILKAVAFLLIFSLVFMKVQDVVTPNRDLPSDRVRLQKSVGGLLREKKDTLDVLWVGSSHVHCGISPMEIYRESGIRSYLVHANAQRIPVAYYMVKEALKHQSPKYVVLDVGTLFLSERENRDKNSWQESIDALPLTSMGGRIEMTRKLAELNNDAFDDDYLFRSVFPLMQYHTNLQLKQADFFDLHLEQQYHRKGFVASVVVKAVKADTYDQIDRQLNPEGGIDPQSELSQTLAEKIQVNIGYIRDLQQLCREHGGELVFMKVPVHTLNGDYRGYWSREKHEAVQKVADELQITFLDLNYEDIDIDWQTDTFDSGRHLNLAGATKLSRFLGHWLTDTCGMTADGDEALKALWDKQLALYDWEMTDYRLRNIYDLKRFLEMAKSERYTVMSCVIGSVSDYWNDDLQAMFTELTGCELDLRAPENAAFAMLSCNGEVIAVKSDDEKVDLTGSMPGGEIPFKIKSHPLSKAELGRIRVSQSKVSSSMTGLQIVIFDNELQWVVDSICIAPGKAGDTDEVETIEESTEGSAAVPVALHRDKGFLNGFYRKMKDYIDKKMAAI